MSTRVGLLQGTLDLSVSSNSRKARFYTPFPKGRKQLAAERSQWRPLAAAIGRVLGPEEH